MIVQKNDQWEIIDIGNMSELSNKKFDSVFAVTKGKIFLGDYMNLKSMDVSINSLKPGYTNPYLHVHVNHEEVYIFLKGKGQMMLDDKIIEVKSGYVVRVEPKVKRGVRNPENSDEELWFICVRAEQPFNRFDAPGAGPVMGVDDWSYDKLVEKAKAKKESLKK